MRVAYMRRKDLDGGDWTTGRGVGFLALFRGWAGVLVFWYSKATAAVSPAFYNTVLTASSWMTVGLGQQAF